MTQEEIFIKYHDRVQSFILSKVGDEFTAEDLTSVTFLKVYQNLEKYDESKAAISTWIYRIANNTVIDHFRTNKTHEEYPEDIEADDSVEDEVLSEEMLDELAAALMKLEERERDIIVFTYYDELTVSQIAEKMGMSYGNVKVVKAKALLKLRQMLQFEEEPV